MSKLLEILGKGISTNPANLMWHWLNGVAAKKLSSSAWHEMNEILGHISTMELEKADEKLRFYLFEYEKCVLGRMAAAIILMHQDKLEEAMQQLQSVYVREPSNTVALYALGYCQERQGHEAEAVEFYQDCIKFKHYLQLPHQRLAAIYFRRGEHSKAIEHYEIIADEHPDDIPSLAMLGHLYMAVGRSQDAIDTFSRAILIHPDNYLPERNEQIQLLIDSGQPEEAVSELQVKVEERPDDAELCIELADLLAVTGEFAESVTYYRKAIRLRPEFLEAAIKLGTAYMNLGQYSLAAQAFNAAAEINEQIVDVYVGLAAAQQQANRPAEAENTLSLAAAIQQNTILLFSETARLQFCELMGTERPTNPDGRDDGILAAVVATHEKQATLKPDSATLQYRLGLLMLGRGRKDCALKAFWAALASNPTYHRAAAKLTLCMIECGQTARAMQHLAASVPPRREIVDLHYRTAMLFCDRERFAGAVDSLQNWMTTNFVSRNANSHIGVVLENMGLIDR
ncbi:MAG TPA: tetratricopeptide repeat protein, partial [Sedimentisphaerales bacterium]|nr:tetratricopeptide repeat protein [Sedimentisphaerales bacterium]